MIKRTEFLDLSQFPPFQGFPKEGLKFLKDLKKNNNRPWFQLHKDEYLEYVKLPMQSLIAALRVKLFSTIPEISFDPYRSIFRIYRDVRFSKDKAPYKTSVAAVFELVGRKRPVETPGLYLHIEPGQIFVGGGIYMPNSQQLKHIRRSIANDPERFLAILKDRKFKRNFGELQGEKLQRAPVGYPAEHPMVEYLRYKQYYIGTELDEKECLKKSFVNKVARIFQNAMPLVRWHIRALNY